jgi:hypothetical protein
MNKDVLMKSGVLGYPDLQQLDQLSSPRGGACPGVSPSLTPEEVAQARDNAMTRYKAKKQNRKYVNGARCIRPIPKRR